MKTIITILILYLLLTTPLNAQWVQTKGLHKKEIHSLIFYKNFLFAGTFQNGIYRSSDNGVTWLALSSELTNKYIHSFAANNSFLFVCTNDGVYRSSDFGDSWTLISPTKDETVSIGVDGALLIINGTYNDQEAIYRSTDNGNSWQLSLPINTAINVFTIRGNNIYAAGNAGDLYKFYRSTNSGLSWSTYTVSEQINSIAVIGNTIFAAGIGGILRSTDYGSTWIYVGLKNHTIVALAVMGTNLFAAGGDDMGCNIYQSKDNGITWNDTGWQQILVEALAVKGNILFAGSSFGVYKHKF